MVIDHLEGIILKGLLAAGLWCFTHLPLAAARAETMSLNLQQVPLHIALQAIADHQRLNLVIADNITGVVTLMLANVHWEQALEVILQSHDLEKKINNNVLLITRQQTQKSAIPVPSLERLYLTIHHAKAVDLGALLKSNISEGLLSKRGTIYVDERTNRLLVQDEKERMAAIKEVVTHFDQPVRQVHIEARIVTMSNEDLNQLGVRWRLGDQVKPDERFNTVFNQFVVNLPVSNASNILGLQLARIHRQQLDLELSALAQENRVEIIATPRLLTADRCTASIKQGSEIPYAVTRAKNTSVIEFREAVLGLEATPTITPQGAILINLKISQNTPGRTIKMGQGEAISIDKQEIHTQVIVNDGETVVLGGVLQRAEHYSNDKIPLLGELPVIGWLFRHQTQHINKKELVIFITPRLVHQKTNSRQ